MRQKIHFFNLLKYDIHSVTKLNKPNVTNNKSAII